MLISIPRDSYLPIPGHGKNKVNAAFAIGGPKLLAKTLEQATGLPIDGYVEIGFGGFAGVVDSLGGVDVCVKRDIKDAKAHIDLKKGCQTLDGKNALGYVRARYSDPKGDLGPGRAAAPVPRRDHEEGRDPGHRAHPVALVGLHPHRGVERHRRRGHLARRHLPGALDDAEGVVRPGPQPRRAAVDDQRDDPAGSSVLWDDKRAEALFTMLRDGEPIEEAPAGTDGVPERRMSAGRSTPPGRATQRRPLESPAAAAPAAPDEATTRRPRRTRARTSERLGDRLTDADAHRPAPSDPARDPDAGDLAPRAATCTAGRRRTWRTWAVLARRDRARASALGGTAYAAWRLNANIARVDVSAAIGTDRPDAGARSRRGGQHPAHRVRHPRGCRQRRATPTATAPWAAGRTPTPTCSCTCRPTAPSATVVSIPRDSMTLGPAGLLGHGAQGRVGACGSGTRTTRSAAPGCLIRTLEGNTGAVHRPLRRRRLPRLQADGRRPRRRRGVHPRGDRRRAHPPAAHRRQAHPRRAPGPAVRAGAQVGRRRVGPAADRPPAGLPVLGDAEGDLDPAAASSPPSSTRSSTRPPSR